MYNGINTMLDTLLVILGLMCVGAIGILFGGIVLLSRKRKLDIRERELDKVERWLDQREIKLEKKLDSMRIVL